ncbi:MAG: hypothetical protein WKG01_32145 [Kofleriaceae bacterium]
MADHLANVEAAFDRECLEAPRELMGKPSRLVGSVAGADLEIEHVEPWSERRAST